MSREPIPARERQVIRDRYPRGTSSRHRPGCTGVIQKTFSITRKANNHQQPACSRGFVGAQRRYLRALPQIVKRKVMRSLIRLELDLCSVIVWPCLCERGSGLVVMIRWIPDSISCKVSHEWLATLWPSREQTTGTTSASSNCYTKGPIEEVQALKSCYTTD